MPDTVSSSSVGTQQVTPAAEVSLQAQITADVAGLAAHLADAVDAHDATAISYLGGPGISATTVEAALDELATEKLDVTVATATYARFGATDPEDVLAPGTEYVWLKTDGAGVLLDIVAGVAS